MEDFIIVDPALLPPRQLSLDELKPVLMAEIDDAVAAIMSRLTRFSLGYEQREAAAIAYKAAGYTGDPTNWISVFATAAGLTNQAATDLILLQAAAMRKALADLEDLRMRKYEIKAQADEATARAKRDELLASIKAVPLP